MLKKIIFTLVCFSILFTISSNATYASDKSVQAKAEVLSIADKPANKTGDSNKQVIGVRILEGEYKDKVIEVERDIIEYSSFNFMLKKGDIVLIELNTENDLLEGILVNVWRVHHLKVLMIIFLISLLVFGKLKGMLSLTGLIFSGFVIIKFLIPNMLRGYNIMILTIISIVLISVVSFILIAGFTKKSLIAILGTVGGTVVAGILSYIYINLTRITGLADEDAMFMVANLGIEIDYRGLYMCSIIIGTVGVVMDVSMSITSSIFEIKNQSPNIRFIDLLKSGLKVGKDVMSTMVNTLVLAYVGSSMPLLIIYLSLGSDFVYSINTEILAIEIIRSLCGSIGIISTIPLTCFLAAYCVQNKTKYKKTHFM